MNYENSSRKGKLLLVLGMVKVQGTKWGEVITEQNKIKPDLIVLIKTRKRGKVWKHMGITYI